MNASMVRQSWALFDAIIMIPQPAHIYTQHCFKRRRRKDIACIQITTPDPPTELISPNPHSAGKKDVILFSFRPFETPSPIRTNKKMTCALTFFGVT
jgi:hypothetical protein